LDLERRGESGGGWGLWRSWDRYVDRARGKLWSYLEARDRIADRLAVERLVEEKRPDMFLGRAGVRRLAQRTFGINSSFERDVLKLEHRGMGKLGPARRKLRVHAKFRAITWRKINRVSFSLEVKGDRRDAVASEPEIGLRYRAYDERAVVVCAELETVSRTVLELELKEQGRVFRRGHASPPRALLAAR